MIEWDPDALSRKYSSTYCIIDDFERDYFGLGYIAGIDSDGQVTYFRKYTADSAHYKIHVDTTQLKFDVDSEEVFIGRLSPLTVRAGYHSVGDFIALVSRKVIKSFKWGVAMDDLDFVISPRFAVTTTQSRALTARLLGVEPQIPSVNGNFERFSNEVARIGDKIYILGTHVGFVNGNDISVKNAAVAKLLSKQLGTPWKINLW